LRAVALLRTAPLALAIVLAAPAAVAQTPAGALTLPTFEPLAGSPSLVPPLVLGAASQDQSRAVHCLTQAIYYEAATEPREGQEAVAQVVLNRLKHPAFPKSVCGVVFEGAERATGCQFTFTCDGSLARAPVAWRWDAAGRVAAAALAGHLANGVGASTHYHAAWMTPYWSTSLVQTTRIGGHVFYRMAGAGGAPTALTGHYSGAEPTPTPVMVAARSPAPTSPRRRGPRATEGSGVSQFSVWGLEVATVSARHGELVVRNGS
jgi:cell wall hydrolase